MTVLRALVPFTRGRRLTIAGGMGGTLLVTASELARPFPLKLVIDRVLAGPAPQIDTRFIGAVAGLVVAIAAVGAIGTYLVVAGMRRAGEHVIHDVRVALYAHLNRLSLRYHRRRHPGDLVTRLTGDVNAVGELVAESLVKVVGAVLLLVGMLAVSLALDPILTLAAAAVTPVLAYATVRSRRAVKRAARDQRQAEGAIAAATTESLTAIETVKALGSEGGEEARLRRTSEVRRDAGVAGSSIEGRFAGLVDVLEAISTALVLGLGVVRVAAGALTPGDLVVMHSYVRRLYRPLRELARQSGRVARGVARAERIVEVLAADDRLEEAADAYQGPRAAGALAFRDVHYRYGDRSPALDGVTLDVPTGATVAIVGPSGAGKSTLASLVARFQDPDAGTVLLDARDLRDCSLRWLRDQVGFVLQDTVLFSGSVADNIGYSSDASRDQIVAAATKAGAHGFIAELPDGYDTPLGPGGRSLSGGQRQRLAIARVLLRDPAVVVLDEPTAGLDAASESAVIASLTELLHDRTTILITHSLPLAKEADLVAVLDRGRIVEQGPPATLLGRSGLFRRLAVQQGLAQAPRIPTPNDAQLRHLDALLDPDTVAEHLDGRLRGSHGVRSVVARYVRYKPGTNAVVDYDVSTAGGAHRAVLMVAADRDLAKRAALPVSRALANVAAARSGATAPLAYVPELDALLQWVPLDIWLPPLARAPVELARAAGVEVDDGAASELLAYKPRRRAVLAVDGHIVKIYADEPDFRAAAAALLAGPDLPVRTARPAGIAPELRVTVRRRVIGTSVADAGALAHEAGALLAELHHARLPRRLRRLDPLTGAAAAARSITALRPTLARTLDRLVARLAANEPGVDAGVLCHGDFHARQLLLTPAGLVVLDLDEWGVGAPAADLATYAAHAHDGTVAGVDRAGTVLATALEGYGRRPYGLEWHVAVATLRRAVFPFRSYPTPDWPEHVDTMVAAADRAFPR